MFGSHVDHSLTFDDIRREEANFLANERLSQAAHRKKSSKTAGLALAGGGIRAAAFSLGVMQALNNDPEADAADNATLLDEMDYVSTVSGGGYAGASLTWFRWLSRSKANTKDQSFIANDKDAEGIRRNTQSTMQVTPEEVYQSELAKFPKPDNLAKGAAQDALNFIRFRKNHLTPTFFLNFISMAAVAFRTSIISLPIYLAILVIFFLALGALAEMIIPAAREWLVVGEWIKFYEKHAAPAVGCQAPEGHISEVVKCEAPALLVFLLSSACLFAFVFWNLLFLALSRGARHGSGHYKYRRNSQRFLGILFTGFFAFTAVWLAINLENLVESRGDMVAMGTGMLAGNSVGALAFGSLLGGGQPVSQKRSKWVIIIVAAILLILNLTAAHEIAEYLLVDSVRHRTLQPSTLKQWWIWLTLMAILVFFAAGWWANLNYVSLNRMYRDRLMEAFMPDLRAIISGESQYEAWGADTGYIANMAQRPYHLVNSHVVLTSSIHAKERGRTGDSFLISPKFCGSRATGFQKTSCFTVRESENHDGSITLATATAISGAAFNPRVGPGGADTLLNNPIVSSMLSYYNLRLGCWLGNPKRENEYNQSRPIFYREGLKGLLSMSFQEDARMIELTDGGHFENTGIYELLQRRTDVIILADATADREFNFKDVGIAIERARADAGVDVRFDNKKWDLTHVMPNSEEGDHYDKRYDLAQRGFAVARIKYPALKNEDAGETNNDNCRDKIGFLIYIKAVMTRELPTDLYGYSGAHEEFPHQPITDQMFDESQFEAYRELGFQVAGKMSEELSHQIKKYLKSPDFIKPKKSRPKGDEIRYLTNDLSSI